MKLLRLLDKITLDKKGKYTCVEGEASGHHHAWMNSEDVEVFNAEVEDQDGTVRQTLLAIVARATDFSQFGLRNRNVVVGDRCLTQVVVAQIDAAAV